MRKHIATVNVEDYFQVGAFSELIPFEHWERFENRIERNVDTSLALLADTGNTATFFASGWSADNHPQILKSISAAGHEVACSGYHQRAVRDLPPQAFREELRRSRDSIENAIGRSVNGFRIGRGRIGPENLWMLDILQEEGFSYDSSISPIGRQFSKQDFRFRLHKHETKTGYLWEIPPSSLRLGGWSVPFFGGNYIRQTPVWPIREAVARWVERRAAPLVMYFHIWELDVDQPNISAAKGLQKIRHYRNIHKMSEKVHYFLNRYPFCSAEEYLNLSSVKVDASPDLPIEITPLANDRIGNREVCIIIPCYNEEASLDYLARTLTKMIAECPDLLLSFVFVNDGSTDSTPAKLQELFGRQQNSTITTHAINKGIAAAILTGAKTAKTELVAVIDADCTFDPMDISEMIKLMDNDTSAVCASPFHQSGSVVNVPKWRLSLSLGAAFLYRCVLNHQFSSYTSCFRIYRREAIEKIDVHFNGFCGVAEILARLDLAGHKLKESPAELQVRMLGDSKINLLATIINHLELIARLAAAKWLNYPLPARKRD